MKYEDRQYQIDAVTALLKSLYHDSRSHPIIAVPTGGGKTVILGKFIYKYLEWRPTHNVLVLSHTETIIEQDHEALQEFFPGIIIGLYSAGLGIKDVQKITVAGIQSAYKNPAAFGQVDLIIVDECHTVPSRGKGMYRKFLKFHSNAIRAGLSATIFRTGSGYVHKGDGALFNRLVYDLCEMEKFNKLVKDGYLTKLFSKPPQNEMDVSGIKTSAGDFNLKDMSEKLDRDSITKTAVNELVKFGKNYKSWLVFAIDIDHADNINNELKKRGIHSLVLHSKSNNDRHEVKKMFKDGSVQAIVSVGMITTGFDAPNIDLIALMRPTKSPVLHVQMIGRGLRISPGKTHCLVLDFAGNVKRLGPINDIKVREKGKKNGNGKPIVKMCPNCGCIHHPSVRICDVCGHKFRFKQNLNTKAGQDDIIAKATTKWVKVTKVVYNLHSKKGRPDSMKVTYHCGLTTVNEYICYDHTGYAKYVADNWVDKRWTLHKRPPSVKELYKYSEYLKTPSEVHIDVKPKYHKIIGSKFN